MSEFYGHEITGDDTDGRQSAERELADEAARQLEADQQELDQLPPEPPPPVEGDEVAEDPPDEEPAPPKVGDLTKEDPEPPLGKADDAGNPGDEDSGYDDERVSASDQRGGPNDQETAEGEVPVQVLGAAAVSGVRTGLDDTPHTDARADGDDGGNRHRSKDTDEQSGADSDRDGLEPGPSPHTGEKVEAANGDDDQDRPGLPDRGSDREAHTGGAETEHDSEDRGSTESEADSRTDRTRRFVTVHEADRLSTEYWIKLPEGHAPEHARAEDQVRDVWQYQDGARAAIEQAVGVYYPVPVEELASRYGALGLTFTPPIFAVPDMETIAKISQYDGGALESLLQLSQYPEGAYGGYSPLVDTGFVFVEDTTPRIATVTAGHECGGHASEEQSVLFLTNPDGTREFSADTCFVNTSINELAVEWVANVVTEDIFGRGGALIGTRVAGGHEVPSRYALRNQSVSPGYTWGQMAIDAAICRNGSVDEALFHACINASSSVDAHDELLDRLDALVPNIVRALTPPLDVNRDITVAVSKDMFLKFSDRSDPAAAVRAATITQNLLKQRLAA